MSQGGAGVNKDLKVKDKIHLKKKQSEIFFLHKCGIFFFFSLLKIMYIAGECNGTYSHPGLCVHMRSVVSSSLHSHGL